MPSITYRSYNGQIFQVTVSAGTSVMEGAVKNNIPGIDGDCGGACACATCHVYVPPEWLSKLKPQEAMELSMLEFAENVQPNSRLGCQIKLDDALDGLTVDLPESQH